MYKKEWVRVDVNALKQYMSRREIALKLGVTVASVNNFQRLKRIPAPIFKKHQEVLGPFATDTVFDAKSTIEVIAKQFVGSKYDHDNNTMRTLFEHQWISIGVGGIIKINKKRIFSGN